MSDLDAIRARYSEVSALVDAWLGAEVQPECMASAADVPALLALVDAQAARINKALEAVVGHGGENGAASGCPSCRVARALTEDVAQ